MLHSGDARTILLRPEPGQLLGDREVRERDWITAIEGEVELTCDEVHATAGADTLVMFDSGERYSV